ILNLLYIFDFFEFPKNVTDQIIKYVFGEMIRRCPSIHDLYATKKFDQVVELSQKLWSINNNDIFLNLKDALISRILSNTILYILDSKLSELDSYHDFISYMAHTLDVSTSEKEIILQSMRDTLQKSSSHIRTLKKQEKTYSYIQTGGMKKEPEPTYGGKRSTDLSNVKKPVTLTKAFEGATAIGVLSDLIPKLYRKIVRFRKTSKAIKKLKTLNNVINLAS
ncbi:MAG: hypothetical protein IJC57_01450, partial [Clostridia bacterium]|nr:hypothetical protein [Clostridia bacterium]